MIGVAEGGHEAARRTPTCRDPRRRCGRLLVADGARPRRNARRVEDGSAGREQRACMAPSWSPIETIPRTASPALPHLLRRGVRTCISWLIEEMKPASVPEL